MISPIICAFFVIFKKLHRVNSHLLGENLSNLVTLFRRHSWISASTWAFSESQLIERIWNISRTWVRCSSEASTLFGWLWSSNEVFCECWPFTAVKNYLPKLLAISYFVAVCCRRRFGQWKKWQIFVRTRKVDPTLARCWSPSRRRRPPTRRRGIPCPSAGTVEPVKAFELSGSQC
jgi:hypothetical protein